MKREIKICGVKTLEVANAVADSGASHIGFVYFKRSPRNISPEDAGIIARKINDRLKTVIVTVNADDALISETMAHFIPDYIQLHGTEDVERVQEIKEKFGLKIIKAISVSNKDDLKKAEIFIPFVDYIMFDAMPPRSSDLPGGNAVSFDWKILEGFNPGYKYILSGGLNPGNVAEAINVTNAQFLDTSSGVETAPGVKNIKLINEFVKMINAF